MKKTFFLLFLSFSFTIYAQLPPLSLPPLNCCDTNNDGFGEFDLTSRIPNLLNGLNPATTVVTFHETELGSQTGTDAIANPSSYTNIAPASQVIYVRIVDNTNGDVFNSFFPLNVEPMPIANPTTLFYCDLMELPIYNLNDANSQITGGVSGATVAYFETLVNAQVNASPIANGIYVPIINPGTQILYARVENATGCSNITTLTLNTHNCGDVCPPPTDLAATNITETTFTLNWQYNPGWMGSIFMRVLVLPYGSPAPASNAPGIDFSSAVNDFTVTGLSPNTCYSVYVKKYCDVSVSSGWSEPLNICMADCANSGLCPELVVLNAFIDSNNNGIKDNGEVNFNNGTFEYQINDSGDVQYGAANSGSYYIFDSNPANSYDFSFTVNSAFTPYYTSSVTHNNFTLPDGSGALYLYFPVINIAPHIDAEVYLYPTGAARPGFAYGNTIAYRNNGLQPISSGTLTYTHGSNVSMTSVSEPGAVATSNGFTYNFTNLGPYETKYINVGLSVPTIPTVSLGDLIVNSASVQVDNEINTSNNTAVFSQAIVGSYDPNDKMEAHGGKIVHSTFTSNDYLYYTIQFENTGTASTEFIRVEDLLDPKLDETSYEMINSSHAVNSKRDGNQLTWHFYNLQLPPTSSNPTASHGYINFRIKPKAGFAIGDIIPNHASIFFDYNPPIVTDAFNTEFVQSMGIPTFNPNAISLYPNPASDVVTITNDNLEKISRVAVYDITGKRIYSLTNNSLETISIDVSSFAKGMYLIELSSENNIKITKKLILK